MSGDRETHRLFDSYEEALEAYQRLQHQSLDDMLPEHLRKQEWREHVDEQDYNAILLWREFRNIYDEVTQQSSLPLYLVVREALKNLKREIASGAIYGRKDANGNWMVTRTDEKNLNRLEELTNLFSLTRFLANKKEQVKVDFKRKFGSLAEQYQEVIDKKLESNLIKKAHHDSMIMELQKWLLGWEDLPLNQIMPDMIEEKLASFRYRKQPLSNATKRRYRTTLHGFFVWAQSRDLIAYNPVERTLAPRAESVQIGIISPSELKKLLQAALEHDRGMLFRLVLAAFCGLRRSECVRITPDAILDEKDEVFVSASIAKTGKQRFVPLPAAAKAWLALAEYEPAPDEIDRLYENRHGRCLKKMAEIAGITLPHNALRHSFASYAAAKTHDIPRVSMWLGHSGTNMTEKHYREGVRAAEGEAWFHVFPEETGHYPAVFVDLFFKLPADVMERLSVSTYVHKVHQGLFRLTPDPGIKKRPVLTGMQRITAEASTTKEKSKKGYYDDIFEENAKRENYTEVAWAIRQEFLQELESKGGRSCSGCARGALVRKYTRKLKEMDA